MEPSGRSSFITQVAIITLLVLACASIVSAQTSPRLTIDCDTFDFGSVPGDCSLAYQTWLRATGEDTLRIVDVKTGCSCLMAPLVGRRILPGDSLMLTLYWRIGPDAGDLEREPYLFIEGETEPHRLWLRAEVTTLKDSTEGDYCQPQKIQFGKNSKRKDYRKIFTIRNISDRDLAVSLVSYPDPDFSVELPDTVAAGSSASGTVVLSDQSATSEFEGSFTMEFTAPEAAASRVSIAVARGDFSFRPTLTTKIDTTEGENPKR